jgi:hypothetical protein
MRCAFPPYRVLEIASLFAFFAARCYPSFRDICPMCSVMFPAFLV